MTEFAYKAKAGPEEIVEGVIQAESRTQAVEQLLARGWHPVTLDDARPAGRRSLLALIGNRVTAWDLAQFTRQLADLLGAGMTLFTALATLEDQIEHRRLGRISHDLSDRIQGGSSLSEALAAHPKVFSSFYVSMVRMGERSGAIEEVLIRMADFAEREDDLRKKIRNAMAYPALMAFVGVITVVVLTVVVIPELASMFEDMGQALPLPTRIMVTTSDVLLSHGWLILGAGAVLVLAVRRRGLGARTRIALDRFALRLPVAGRLLRKTEMARFGRGLSLLLRSGVPFVQALDVMAATLRTRLYRDAVVRIGEQVLQGEKLGACLRRDPHFSAYVANTATIGEESGNLESALGKMADTFEREVDQALKLFTSLLEPLLILVIGGIIGFLVFSMMLPILQMDVMLN